MKGVDRANDEYNTLRQGGQMKLGVRGNYGGHPPHCFHRAGKSAQQLLTYFPCLLSSLSCFLLSSALYPPQSSPLTLFGDARELLMKCYCSSGAHTGSIARPSRGCERQLQWELSQNERDRSALVMPSHRRSWAFSSPTTEQHKWHANSENARQKLPDHYKHVKKEEN